MSFGAEADANASGKSLANMAYENLRDRLLTLEIQPGELLNDEKLAKELGMGRTPVREALKRLELDRLVVSHTRRGTFATRVELTDLAYLSEIRSELEPLAAARAAKVATEGSRKELVAVLEALESFDAAGATVVEMLRMDARVHRGIYRAAANPFLEDILIRCDNLATRIWCLVLERLPDLTGHVQEHLALLRAVLDGDQARAGELALLHITGFDEAVRETLFRS